MFNWLRNRRRGELRDAPFPEEWCGFLRRHVAHYDWLTDEERERLQGDIQVFIAEKEWEGIKGFPLSDEIKVVIAAQACLLMLGWKEPHYFPNVSTVIVYPAGFHAKSRRRVGYVESEEQMPVLGEAWSGNLPVIVSWDDAREGGESPEDGQNVILHEFAHKLDMLEGGADGVPPLRGGDAAYDTWAEVMSREFRTLRRSLWEGQESVINGYGAENEAEFFAVITETFFEKPYYLQVEHPNLYEVLKSYYEQDTVSRWKKWKLRASTTPDTDNRLVTDVSFPAHPADYIPEDPSHEEKSR